MNALALFAQAARPALWGWGLTDFLILIVVLAACAALTYIALRQFGITIPAWAQQVAWIVIVAFVVILAIRLVLSM